jgi:hypothetical protein
MTLQILTKIGQLFMLLIESVGGQLCNILLTDKY